MKSEWFLRLVVSVVLLTLIFKFNIQAYYFWITILFSSIASVEISHSFLPQKYHRKYYQHIAVCSGLFALYFFLMQQLPTYIIQILAPIVWIPAIWMCFRSKITKIPIWAVISWLYINLFLFFHYASIICKYDMSLLYMAIWIIVISDSGGYIVGKIGVKIWKPKFVCVPISPNKTIVGFISALISPCLLVFFKTTNILPISSILLFSSACIIGDLFMSFCKRICRIKNTGKIFPGHGGLLDRLDGCMAVFTMMGWLIENGKYHYLIRYLHPFS